DLMVIPRSRSMSMRSRYCARMCRWSTTPVSCSMRSASVDFPWSMWAIMQKLRISSGGVAAGWGTVAGRARGDTLGLDLVRYVVGWAVLLVSHGSRGAVVPVTLAPPLLGSVVVPVHVGEPDEGPQPTVAV